MSVSNPQKTVAPAAIPCMGTALVTLRFDATAELTENPADIVLIMDRSYSMDLTRMFNARAAARELIRTVADASAEAGAMTIGGGSRIGMVSFASQATVAAPLTDSVSALNSAVTALSAGGNTNHRAAFEAAETLLGPKGRNRQIVLMFTDGLTTTGGDATEVSDRMKAAGIEIYCVGLMDNPLPLEQWASLPLDDHISFTSEPRQLGELFQAVAARIVIPGAQDVIVREEVSEDFRITAIRSAETGTARITGPRTLIWNVDTAGLTLDPTPVTMTFEIMHTGASGGALAFNEALTYEDRAGSSLTFPSPTINVSCGAGPIYPEPCPQSVGFTVSGCQDALRVKLSDVQLLSLGRILQLDVTIKAVCPGKRLAVSIVLAEVAPDGSLWPRGVKHILVPAQEGEGCRDVELGCIPFSVPEALNAGGNTGTLCSARNFQAQVIANYVDTDFVCCGEAQPPVCTFCGC